MNARSIVRRLDGACIHCGSPDALRSIYFLRDTLIQTNLFKKISWIRKLEFLIRVKYFLKRCRAEDDDGVICSALREALFVLCFPVEIKRKEHPEAHCCRQIEGLRVFRDFYERFALPDGPRYEQSIFDDELTVLEDSCNYMFAYNKAYETDRLSTGRMRRVKKNMKSAYYIKLLTELNDSVAASRSAMHEAVQRQSEDFE